MAQNRVNVNASAISRLWSTTEIIFDLEKLVAICPDIGDNILDQLDVKR